jgi:hypothetical protein
MLSQEATGMTITGHAIGHIVEVKINDISIETRPDQHLASQNDGGDRKAKPNSQVCGELTHIRSNSENRPDLIYAKVIVGYQETTCVIDCGSTVTIIREDMATAFDLKITNYSGGKVNGVTGDKLVPIGKAHIKMTIEDSLGQRVHVHADPIVVKYTPIKFLVGNNVKMKTKCVIDFADKTLKFNTNALQSYGIYMVICKQCIAGGGNAVHIKQDCILPARATTVTRVVTGKSCVEDVVCMVASNLKNYTKYQLLIPNSVTDIKCGETTVAISIFSNEPKRIKARTMIGFYEKTR